MKLILEDIALIGDVFAIIDLIYLLLQWKKMKRLSDNEQTKEILKMRGLFLAFVILIIVTCLLNLVAFFLKDFNV